MASKKFKQVLLIRFVAHLSVIIAILSLVFEFGPILSAEFKFRLDQLTGVSHSLSDSTPTSDWAPPAPGSTPTPSSAPTAQFGNFLNLNTSSITPVSTDYGIVIEKINANAKVVADVDTGDERAYSAALAQGVGEARGSTEPGKPGNLYIFSHSTDAPWNIVRFNAIFYLLRELEKGDRVVVFYKGRRFDYIVYDKSIVDPHDLSFLANRYDQPVLTLQTCDPPGTLLHRLIVRAKLEGY